MPEEKFIFTCFVSGSLHGRRKFYVYVGFITGVFDVQVYTIIIVIPYVYALHKWTEHIFVKWPTGNNGIHHEEKT